MKTCIICIGSNHNPSSNITKAVETLSTLFPDILWGETVVTPAEGVYVAPRAPFDDWNMWFRAEMNDFFRMLIAAAVVEMEVNPDKVYLLGYSAGGDGVWRMAPRMADRWAAASMIVVFSSTEIGFPSIVRFTIMFLCLL